MPKIQRRHFLGLFLLAFPALVFWKKTENDLSDEIINEYQTGKIQYLNGWSYSQSELSTQK